MDNNRLRGKAIRTKLSFVGAVIVAYVAFGFAVDPFHRMGVNFNTSHQLMLVSWIHRSLFQGAGELLSPPVFIPSKGVLAATDVPLLQGILFGVFRELSLPPVFAWNLLYVFATLANLGACYLMLREEGIERTAALLGSFFYTQTYYIFGLENAIYYRTAFGLPLAWWATARMHRKDRMMPSAALLSLVLILQLMSSATLGLATLILVSARIAGDPRLRNLRTIGAAALSIIPTAALGLLWWRASAPLLMQMGLDRILGVREQLLWRLDLLSFLPIPGKRNFYSPSAQWPHLEAAVTTQPTGALGPIPLELWPAVLLALLEVAMARRRVPGLFRSENPLFRTCCLLGTVVLLGLLAPAARRVFDGVPLPSGIVLSTSLIWVGIAALLYRSVTKGGLIVPVEDVPPATFLALFIGIALSLGPLVFAFGHPIALGPLALLDAFVPGAARIRMPARFLLISSVPLCLLASLGIRRILADKRIPRLVGPGAILLVLLALPPTTWFPIWWPTSVALPEEACPRCGPGNMNEIPLPYRWLQENGDGEPLAELPMGGAEVAHKGKPPLGGHDATYQFYHALDGIPRINGANSYAPEDYWRLPESTRNFPDAESLNAAKSRGAKWLLVHGNRYPEDEWERLRRQLDPPPEGLKLEKTWGPVWLFRVE